MEDKDECLFGVGSYAEMEISIFKERLKPHKEDEDFSVCLDKCVEYMKMIQEMLQHMKRM